MLKKIVKYGNSCALVLDKALLELLNMAEGSIVKIKTDGISLIITPQKALVQETVSETLTVEGIFNDIGNKAFELSLGSPEKVRAYQTACKEITDRYVTITKNQQMNIPEMRQVLEIIQKHFSNKEANPEYVEQIKTMDRPHVSELEQMYQELDTVVQEHFSQDENIKGSSFEFAKVHAKYEHLTQAMTALNENPEYVHEMVLLAEKYQLNKNPTTPPIEYLEEYPKLISKYIPEYMVYIEEIKKVGEQFFHVQGNEKPT